jgi:hypothetical protein
VLYLNVRKEHANINEAKNCNLGAFNGPLKQLVRVTHEVLIQRSIK